MKKLIFTDKINGNRYLVAIVHIGETESSKTSECLKCFRFAHAINSGGLCCTEVKKQLGSCKNIYFKFLKFKQP